MLICFRVWVWSPICQASNNIFGFSTGTGLLIEIRHRLNKKQWRNDRQVKLIEPHCLIGIKAFQHRFVEDYGRSHHGILQEKASVAETDYRITLPPVSNYSIYSRYSGKSK